MKSEREPPKVRSTQPALFVASMENLFRLQMSRVGMASHWAQATTLQRNQRKRDESGVARRRAE